MRCGSRPSCSPPCIGGDADDTRGAVARRKSYPSTYVLHKVKNSYKLPWARGQRGIIPADWFDEPNWETGKNEWWRFRRADGEPWGLAGLANVWKDPASGEEMESYTMLTINTDHHPLMKRMHKPDPKLGPTEQDKRSVIAIEQGDADQWLAGTFQRAQELLQLSAVEVFDAGPRPT